MPSLQVIDANNATQTIQTLPAVGSAATSAALPVGIASDQLYAIGAINQQTVQVLGIGTSSAASALVSASTYHVIISATVDCWVTIAANPTANIGTAPSFFVPAGAVLPPMTVTPNTTKIAVISSSTQTGYLSIIESL